MISASARTLLKFGFSHACDGDQPQALRDRWGAVLFDFLPHEDLSYAGGAVQASGT